jgi:hypothetical protein
MDDHKYLFKVVLVGNAGVGLLINIVIVNLFNIGKTCLVRKFTQVSF